MSTCIDTSGFVVEGLEINTEPFVEGTEAAPSTFAPASTTAEVTTNT